MKERESIELTKKPANPTLSEGANIFMPEPGGGETPSITMVDRTEEAPQKPSETRIGNIGRASSETERKAMEALRQLTKPGEDASLEERSSYELVRGQLMKMAGKPEISGGSDDEPQGKITDELKDYIIKSKGGASIGITRNLRRILRENGVPKAKIDYFANHPEEFRQSLDTMLLNSEQMQDVSTPEQVSQQEEGEDNTPDSSATEGGGGDDGDKPPAPPEGVPQDDSEEEIGSQGESHEATPASGASTPEETQARIEEKRKRDAESATARLTASEAEELEEVISAARSAGLSGDDLKTFLATAATTVRAKRRKTAKTAAEMEARGESSGLPESLEDLAEIIMRTEGEAWRQGGERELINEKGEIVKENFLAWVRKRMWEIDDFNQLSAINLFSDIYVKRGWMQISFYEMISTGSYFLKKREEADGSISLHKDDDYEKLKGELIREAYTYNSDKNASVTYIKKMHSEKETPEMLNELWYGNPNLRADYLERTLTLSSTKKEKISEVKKVIGDGFEGKEIEKILEGNSDLGEGIRRAFLTYFHISDIEMLYKIHGEDSILFSEKLIEADDSAGVLKTEGGIHKLVTGKANDEAKEGKKIEYGEDGKLLRYVYDYETDLRGNSKIGPDGKKIIKRGPDGKPIYKRGPDGNLVINRKNLERFRDYINIYNDSDKDSRVVNEVRLRIREYLMDKEHGLGLDYEEARFAETWALNKTRPMLIGARNDLRASAFDSASRNLNMIWYRDKQFETKRKGQIGNIFDIGVVRRTSLTPLEEITDVHGRTIIEVIQGGQGGEYDPALRPFDKTREGYKSLEFGESEGQRWASMAYGNGDGIKNILIQGGGFDIENFVTTDEFGRTIIDQKKADEFLEEVQKKLRYKWSTYPSIDYGKTVRVWDQIKTPVLGQLDRDGQQLYETTWEYKDVPIAAAYFGPEVLGFIKSDIERVKDRIDKSNRTPEEKDEAFRESREENVWHIDGIGGNERLDLSQVQNKNIRDFLWKHIEKVLVAKTIESHRNVNSELRRYNFAMVEKFYDFFRAKGIFDEKDEEEVKKLSKTTQGRLLAEEVPPSAILGMMGGIWKELKKEAPKLVK